MNELVKIDNLSKSFYTMKGEIEAIRDLSLTINEGEFISIVGTSGCGKSTLISIIANLESYDKGKVLFNIDKPVIGYMLQEDALLPYYSVLDNVLLGLKIQGKCDEQSKNYVIELLRKYNLEKFIDKYPRELSGGMKQRVALIRTLALKPDILLLDEPFSALDYSTRLSVSDDVYKIIKELGITTIMVTHDIGEAIAMGDKVVVLSRRPAMVKNIFDINLENKDIPTNNRKDKMFNYYFDSIRKDLDNNE